MISFISSLCHILIQAKYCMAGICMYPKCQSYSGSPAYCSQHMGLIRQKNLCRHCFTPKTGSFCDHCVARLRGSSPVSTSALPSFRPVSAPRPAPRPAPSSRPSRPSRPAPLPPRLAPLPPPSYSFNSPQASPLSSPFPSCSVVPEDFYDHKEFNDNFCLDSEDNINTDIDTDTDTDMDMDTDTNQSLRERIIEYLSEIDLDDPQAMIVTLCLVFKYNGKHELCTVPVPIDFVASDPEDFSLDHMNLDLKDVPQLRVLFPNHKEKLVSTYWVKKRPTRYDSLKKIIERFDAN
jgi:hypothetical protein